MLLHQVNANPFKGNKWTVLAKKQGYPARSVFKLQAIHEQLKVFEAGDIVLDLGCAPGSWAMYASKQVALAHLLPFSCLALDMSRLSPAYFLPVSTTFRYASMHVVAGGLSSVFVCFRLLVSALLCPCLL